MGNVELDAIGRAESGISPDIYRDARVHVFGSAGGIAIRTESDRSLLFDRRAHLLAAAYIPGFSPAIDRWNAVPEAVIAHTESDDKRLAASGRTVTIADRWNGTMNLDYFNLLYGVTRMRMLSRGLYPVHAACVEGHTGYVLMVGHSGVGKTTMLLRLAEDYGRRVFSGNKTAVSLGDGDAIAEGGTHTITVRGAYAGSVDTSLIAYSDRTAFWLPGASYAPEPRVPIAAIVLPHLNDAVSEQGTLSPMSAVHTLYAYFMDSTKADTVLCDGRAVLPGTPDAGVEDRLAGALTETCRHIPVYAMAGSLADVTERIAAL